MPPTKPDRAIIFVVDGLRPDGLRQAATPHIDRLAARGAYTWQARTVTPSVTLPCHVSLFCGVPPARHGVVSNVWTPPRPPVPSLFELVHQATSTHPPPYSHTPTRPHPHTSTPPHPHTSPLPHAPAGTAAFYDWEQLRDLAPPGALDFAYYHRLGDPPQDRTLEIAAVAASYLVEHTPALAFVYLGATDAVGHRHGWMSQPYLQAVASADRAIGRVLDPLRAAGSLAHTVCLVLADHGGHDFDHSAGGPEDVTIPWIVSGPSVRRGHPIAAPVDIVDTAPTVAHLLGLSPPAEWSGRVVAEALA